MKDAEKSTGHCLCRKVGFKFDPDCVKWVGHCYCESCRRATASPVTTFVGVERAGLRWFGTAPHAFESSPGVTRRFCGTCGTQMSYESTEYPDEVHVYAATLLDPSWLTPESDYHHDERLPWGELKGSFTHR